MKNDDSSTECLIFLKLGVKLPVKRFKKNHKAAQLIARWFSKLKYLSGGGGGGASPLVQLGVKECNTVEPMHIGDQ